MTGQYNTFIISVDVTTATAARSPDGALPVGTLFRLATNSKLVDASVDVGLSFKGRARDLGAFESGN